MCGARRATRDRWVACKGLQLATMAATAIASLDSKERRRRASSAPVQRQKGSPCETPYGPRQSHLAVHEYRCGPLEQRQLDASLTAARGAGDDRGDLLTARLSTRLPIRLTEPGLLGNRPWAR
ncbi:hypothetical protein MRX96_009777 [Rhipicephalus microplus]